MFYFDLSVEEYTRDGALEVSLAITLDPALIVIDLLLTVLLDLEYVILPFEMIP